MEVSAPKPGNVHRGADFEDLKFEDFVISAEILGQTIDSCRAASIGTTILAVIQATMSAVATNTNLGISLLICPLAKAIQDHGQANEQTARQVINALDESDCRAVYESIRIANPGGLGVVGDMDVADAAPTNLVTAMSLAGDRDMVARQYANGFCEIFEEVVPLLCRGREQLGDLRQAIVYTHVDMISRHGDSLIARKCGPKTSDQAKFFASKAIDCFESDSIDAYFSAVGDLDFWMRSDGHRRNPGTTADMIAAGLFVALASGQMQVTTET